MPFRPDPFLKRFEPLRRARRSALAGYGVAVTGVAVATAAGMALDSVMQQSSFMTFFPVLIIATFFGGWGSGLAAVALSTLAADYFLVPPLGSWSFGPESAGSLAGFVLVGTGIVGVVKLLNVAVDRLALQAEKAEFMIETAPTGVVAIDADGFVQLANATVERQLGYDRDELLGMAVEDLVPHDMRESHAAHRNHYMDAPEPRMMGEGRDLSALRRDGALLPVEVGLSPFERFGARGTVATIIDISERRRAQERQAFLVGEIRHRSRNLLAIVRALATRRLPKAASGEFLGVLDAMERTQELFLTEGRASLRSIVEAELALFADQVTIDDCDFVLAERTAQDFTLIVHELATNALKYGALSSTAGRVFIVGTCQGAVVRLVWGESGGPLVTTPERLGFGHRVLHGVPASFGGKAEIEFEPSGLIYSVTAPAAAMARGDAHPERILQRARP